MQQLIRSRRVVLQEGIQPAGIFVDDGRIARIVEWEESFRTPAVSTIDVGDMVVMPGLVDAHVHVNEPGRTEWEGYETATRAAAAGGVTTIVDMPLNSIPPTTTLENFETKLAAAAGQCTVDVAFWGGVVPGNTSELERLVDAGVRGFKCFLIHSGVDEFPNVSEDDLRVAMPEIARLGSVLLVHAEVPGPIEAAAENIAHEDQRSYQTFLHSRPRDAENQAIELMIRLCRDTGCRVHIVHHSSSDALPMLRAAKAAGLPLTVETCPHYLTFAAEDIPDGVTQFKCCPPVREGENREKLWEAVAGGTIDMIVSDHSPCTPSLKLQDSGDFLAAWGGISALQFGLPVMWTNMRERGYSISDVARLMCGEPARLAGLDDRKGQIAVGYDADLVVLDPEREFTVRPEHIYHRHKLTPYAGMQLFGHIEATYLSGQKIFGAGGPVGYPSGSLIH